MGYHAYFQRNFQLSYIKLILRIGEILDENLILSPITEKINKTPSYHGNFSVFIVYLKIYVFINKNSF